MSVSHLARVYTLVALLTTQFVGLAHGENPDAKRWAIVSATAVRESGLSDMLLAQLSGLPGIKLVEREQIEAATRELALGEILGPTGVRTRADLGKLLGADVLLMLNLEKPGKEQMLRIVISDCQQGTRLWTNVLPFPGPGVEKNAHLLFQAAQQTQSRFPRGVQSIVAVPQFVSHTLVHDYDYLQAGLARLAESAAWSVPNLAVVEIEEASAIRKERELSGAGGIARVVALFLEGEYEVSEASPGQPKVKVKLRARDASRVVGSFDSGEVSLPSVPGLLREQVLKTLSIPTEEGTALSARRQFELLAERADAFARLGAWEHSIALRESCLLLDPASMEQRRYGLEEYLRLLGSHPEAQKLRELPAAKVEELTSAYFARWRRGMAHLEFVIRNRAATAHFAISCALQTAKALDDQKWKCPTDMQEELVRAQREMKNFIKTVYPLALGLELGGTYHSQDDLVESWQQLWLAMGLEPFPELGDPNAYTKWRSLKVEDFAALVDALERNPAPQAILDDKVLLMLKEAAGKVEGPAETAFKDALETLKESSKPMSRLYGRYGLILSHSTGIKRLSRRGERPTSQELATFLAEARSCDRELSTFGSKEHRSGGLRLIISACREAERLAAASAGKEMAKPIASSGPMPIPASTSTDRGQPSLEYEVVPFQLRKLSGEQCPLAQYRWATAGPNCILGIVPCEDRFDVLWGPFAVLFHRERGITQEVLVDAKAQIQGVTWDGLYVWVANLQEGLVLLDRAGKQAASINRDRGLPPCDGNIKLFPLSPGRVFAVGCFGQPLRTWCAIIEWQNGKVHVNIFHQATHRLAPGDAPVDPWRDTTLAFSFDRILQTGPADPDGNRILLIPRGVSPSMDFRDHPLVIDTRVPKVTVSEYSYPRAPFVPLPDGSFLEATMNLAHCAAPGTHFSDGASKHQLSTSSRSWALDNALFYDGCVYLPGNDWHRLDLKTFRLERISEGSLPSGMRLNAYYNKFLRGVSSHFGLMMWNHEQRFCRIRVNRSSGSTPDHSKTESGPK